MLSKRKQQKAAEKRYKRTVEIAVTSYMQKISAAKETKGKKSEIKYHQNRLDGFIKAVRETPEYKENPRKYEKLIRKTIKKSK